VNVTSPLVKSEVDKADPVVHFENGSGNPTKFRLTVLMPVYNERHQLEAAVRRVLAFKDQLISSLDLIIVDDSSSDGSWEILQRLAGEDSRITLLRHERNQGKGAAIRTAIAQATGDISIVQDADFEYNPADIPALLVPFAAEGADAVFGSRYLSAPYRLALRHRHTMMNRALTFLSNWLTDLTLTDLETGYKAINTTLLKSIPIRSNDFRFEVEIVFKLAKRRARVFEVPIRYLPRTQREGKKIGALDGLRALLAMLYFSFIDDLYKRDKYGSHILAELEHARRLNTWLGDKLRPYIGQRVLEIGAGVGNLTSQFIPRDLYFVSDVNPNYLQYLRSYAIGKPYLHVMELDAGNPSHFAGLGEQFDTILMINVLEHLRGRQGTLRNLWASLRTRGRAVVVVPQHRWAYGSLVSALGHQVRYQADELKQELVSSGFEIETVFDFNRVSVPGWWVNGRIFRRKTFSRVQIKVLELIMPLARRIDRFWPWSGLSLVAVGAKKI